MHFSVYNTPKYRTSYPRRQ